MRALVKEITWAGLLAMAMTTCLAVPVATAFAVGHFMLEPQGDVMLAVVLVLGTFLFFLNLALIQVLQHRRRLRERGMPTPVERDEETQLMQELYQRSLRMDKRLESLETILLGRTEHREPSEF